MTVIRDVVRDVLSDVCRSPLQRYGGVSLVFDALGPNTSNIMTGVITGTGDLTTTCASGLNVVDHEGVYRSFAAAVPYWRDGRVVENLVLNTADVTGGNWSTSYFTNGTAPDGEACFLDVDAPASSTLIFDSMTAFDGVAIASVDIYTTTPGLTVNMGVKNPSGADTTIAVPANQWTRISVSNTVASGESLFWILRNSNKIADIYLKRPQYENATGRSDTDIPSEYVASGATAGFSVYSTSNGISVASNVVTEATGSALSPVPPLHYQQAATNSQIQSNDLTNVEWTASNVTVAQDAVGIDGVANSACTLTATAGNGTVVANALVDASDDQATCWYMKRKTGTGNIDLTLDNGGNWTTVVLTSSFQKFTVDQAALANPQIGIRIVTDTDAVIVANAEAYLGFTEQETRGLMPIFTAGAAVTTNRIDFTFDDANHDQAQGGYSFKWTPRFATAEVSGDLQILSLADGANLCYYDGTNGDIETADGTNTITDSLTIVAGTEYEVSIAWGGSELGIAVDAGAWSEGSYDGGFALGTVLELFNGNGYPQSIRDLKRYAGSYADCKGQLDSDRGA